jgi:hypothetical protein
LLPKEVPEKSKPQASKPEVRSKDSPRELTPKSPQRGDVDAHLVPILQVYTAPERIGTFIDDRVIWMRHHPGKKKILWFKLLEYGVLRSPPHLTPNHCAVFTDQRPVFCVMTNLSVTFYGY